jgi:hypothetical protein
MTVQQIIQAANTTGTNINIKEDEGRKLVNYAVSRLTALYDSAYKRSIVTVNTETFTSGYYEMPDDCRGVVGIYTTDTARREKIGHDLWNIDDRKVYIDCSGAYEIEYLRAPTPLADKTEEPDINPVFHDCMYLYLIGSAGKDQDAMGEFYAQAQVIDMRASQMKRRGNTIRRRW